MSRAELIAGCGALFSSYLNGIDVTVSPTLEAKDFRRCWIPEISVFEAVGNTKAQVNSLTELP